MSYILGFETEIFKNFYYAYPRLGDEDRQSPYWRRVKEIKGLLPMSAQRFNERYYPTCINRFNGKVIVYCPGEENSIKHSIEEALERLIEVGIDLCGLPYYFDGPVTILRRGPAYVSDPVYEELRRDINKWTREIFRL